MKQTRTAREELQQSPGYVEPSTESNQQSGEISYREPLEDSAIILVNENEQWFAILGRNRITEIYETKEQLIEFTKTWRFKLSVFSVVAEHLFIELIKERNQEYVAGILNNK